MEAKSNVLKHIRLEESEEETRMESVQNQSSLQWPHTVHVKGVTQWDYIYL